MQNFASLLKSFTKLKSVKAEFQDCNKKTDDSRAFLDEIKFYTDSKNDLRKKEKKQQKRMQSCDNSHMFEKMLEHVENADETEKMPVRKFFNNTFG